MSGPTEGTVSGRVLITDPYSHQKNFTFSLDVDYECTLSWWLREDRYNVEGEEIFADPEDVQVYVLCHVWGTSLVG